MKRYRGLVIFALLAALCAGIIWLVLRFTAQYPVLGAPVSYSVNQIEGFELSIEKPAYSFLRGYTLRYDIAIDSEEIYYLTEEQEPFEHLETLVNGQWYRLEPQREHVYNSITFDLGGNGDSGFGGSLVQKYAGFGTRLDPGTYRLTLELTDQQGILHYLAAEFEVG